MLAFSTPHYLHITNVNSRLLVSVNFSYKGSILEVRTKFGVERILSISLRKY